MLNRQLKEDSHLGLQDFDVLVQLTDTADGRRRVGALAAALQWERSRMSHHVKRMEARGLLEREDCEDDQRGAFVRITEPGRRAITSAAPQHVALVRQVMFDGVTDDELTAVGSYLDRAITRLLEPTDADQQVSRPRVPPSARSRCTTHE